ncbi:MAG: response regulator transcription factor [Lachnospiraceae bacterium]|nr:response regulator transcription factor [Lachnospiraceae bacterium]
MTKILIAEDDKEINRLLSEFLKNQGYEVISVFNGLEANSIIHGLEDVSLILLDLMLPYKSGDMVLAELRESSDIPVIIISAKDAVRTKIELIHMGADDYITKPFDLDEISVRIEAVLRRVGRDLEDKQNRILKYKDLTMDCESKTVSVNGNILVLTGKEYAILNLMLKNKSKLFSKANLFESVWSEPYYNEDNTLKVHMSNIRSKIKQYAPDDEYIETVWGMGYRLKKQ